MMDTATLCIFDMLVFVHCSDSLWVTRTAADAGHVTRARRHATGLHCFKVARWARGSGDGGQRAVRGQRVGPGERVLAVLVLRHEPAARRGPVAHAAA